MGDPAGVGPEIIAMSLAQEYAYTICRPVVVGDAKMMELGVKSAKVDLQVRPIAAVSEAQFERGVIDVLDLKLIDPATFAYGEVSAQCGHAAFEAVRTAIELAMKGEVDGTVTAPLNKEALHVAGHNFAGHTEIYAHYTDTKKYAMLLADDKMRVIHVSTHVSLREACDRAKKERVIAVTELIREACLSFGIAEFCRNADGCTDENSRFTNRLQCYKRCVGCTYHNYHILFFLCDNDYHVLRL